jgi:hypothetical protein
MNNHRQRVIDARIIAQETNQVKNNVSLSQIVRPEKRYSNWSNLLRYWHMKEKLTY